MRSAVWQILKGSGHYWYLLKTIIGIKHFLVPCKGEKEVDGIKRCEKRLPLKCHSYQERSIFPRIWFRDLTFRTGGLEINHLNAHNFVWQGLFFLSLLSRNFDDRLSSYFHRFVILCICWDIPTVKASLWHLPIVSTALKIDLNESIVCVLITGHPRGATHCRSQQCWSSSRQARKRRKSWYVQQSDSFWFNHTHRCV